MFESGIYLTSPCVELLLLESHSSIRFYARKKIKKIYSDPDYFVQRTQFYFSEKYIRNGQHTSLQFAFRAASTFSYSFNSEQPVPIHNRNYQELIQSHPTSCPQF